MADPKIKIKRSSVEGRIPTPDQVPLGELALNTYDGYLYASKNVGIGTTVIAINPFRVGTGTDSYNAYFTAGSVGIGTTNPAAGIKLEVLGGEIKAGRVDTGSEGGQVSFGRASDNNTGWYIDVYGNTSTPDLRFVDVSNAAVRAVFSGSGNFGIKNATPTSALDVSGDAKVSGVLTATSFYGDGSNLTGITATGSSVVIKDDGVLSGTATTIDFGSNLSVSFSSGTATITASSGSSSQWVSTNAGIHTLSNVGVGTTNPVSRFETQQSTTTETDLTITNSSTANNTTKGSRLRFRLTDTVGTQKDVAYIAAYGNNSDSSLGDYLAFYTRTVDSTPTEKVRITGIGSVGIGTINPTKSLHIYTSDGNIKIGDISEGAVSTDSGIIFDGGGSTTSAIFTEVDGTILSLGSNCAQITSIETARVGGIFRFDTRLTGNFGDSNCFVIKARSKASSTEYNALVVDLHSGTTALSPEKGNVGIGTTNPTSKLHVVGDTIVSGTTTATSFVKSGGTSSQFLKADGSVDSSTYLTTTGSGTNLTGIVTYITAGSGISVNNNTGNVTITATGGGGGGVNYWEQTSVGINTLSNVGIGTTNPTSKLTVSGDTNIIGGLNVSGITTLAGNINLGDNTADDITVSGEFVSNLIPDATNTYDLGSSTQKWRDVWSAGTVTANSFSGSGTNLTGIVTSIVAGTNVTVSGSTGQVTINATGGGGGGSISIANTSVNDTYYIGIASTSTGTLTTLNVATTGLTFNPSTGNLVAGGTVTANSDESLKENIKTIENALDKVLALRGVEFDRIDNGDHQIGVIAQEVEKIMPEVVYPKQPAPNYEKKSVAYANLIGLLIEAIKELNDKIESR